MKSLTSRALCHNPGNFPYAITVNTQQGGASPEISPLVRSAVNPKQVARDLSVFVSPERCEKRPKADVETLVFYHRGSTQGHTWAGCVRTTY